MQEKKLLSRIAMLPAMSATDLKKMWRDLYDSEPPIFNRAHLEQRLTYRLQEIAYGGLTEKTIEKMKRLRDGKTDRQRKRTAKPPAGTVLLKEYEGIEHRVRVLPDGFDYNGQKFKSLTAIAFNITGTRWNGPLFFGLRK
jgi:hypothetical protein